MGEFERADIEQLLHDALRLPVSRRWMLRAAAVGSAAALVACTPGAETSQAVAPPEPAKTGVTETGPLTLTIWDQEQGGRVSKVWDQLNSEFTQKYPNVTINRVSRGFGDLQSLLKLALTGPHAPDVVEANQGWPDMGSMVKAGLLLPLDNYAKAYGWFDRVSANVNQTSSWSPDGKQFGAGSLFGFTTMGELVGVYYNKTKLTQLGIAVPTTFAEFETSLETAKQGGQVPINFADLDQFAGAHEWAAVQERFVPEQYMKDFIFGLQYDKLSFDTPENLQAATRLQEWVQKEYFTKDFLAIGYDDSVNYYARGQGVYMITGNWIVENLGAENTEFGFMPMPPNQVGDAPVSTGGPGFPLAIASTSKHPDAAAAYIDWMTSDHAAQLLVPTGQIPLHLKFTSESTTPGTLLAELLTASAQVNESNAIVPYEDWATPSFYNTLTSGIQELMGMRLTPQQYLSQVQKDYGDFQSSRPSPAASVPSTTP